MFNFLTRLSSMFVHSKQPHTRMFQQPGEESFSSLLVEDLCTNTDAFLTVYRDGISRSPDPVAAMTRFQVQNITGNKGSEFTEHELLSVKVLDRKTHCVYNFYIERSASPKDSHSSDYTSDSPISPKLASSVSASTSSISATDNNKTSAPSPEFHPLLTLDNPSGSLLPSPSPSASQSSLVSSSQYPLRERLTLALTQVMHSSSTSLDCRAEDRILGRGMFVRNSKIFRDIGHVVRQISPIEDLSLFELGILVDVIHNEAPVYSLLNNQCYWFVNAICDLVVIMYGDKDRLSGIKGPSDYLPNLAGRWKSMRIVAPHKESLKRMVIKFTERQDREFSEVLKFSISFIYLF